MHWSYCNIEDFSHRELEMAWENLSPSRKEHIFRLRQQEDKIRSLAGEILAQRILKEQFGISSALLHRDPNGRPYLTGCSLHLSISHCNKMVACAVSREPVGIDIEQIRPIKPKLCNRVCVEEEKAYVLGDCQLAEDRSCENPEVARRFFEIWTAKEAYFKKLGTGITDLQSVNILHLPRQMEVIDGYMVQIV